MTLATRLDRLGTETAFAVSGAAAVRAAQGHKVYPFHLGDLNLATPSNIVTAMNAAIAAGKTGYCPAAGIAPLREALAEDVGRRRGLTFSADNVVVQTGGKPVITKFIQSIMNPGDTVLYPNPGYPIYESQIEYFGGVAQPYSYLRTADGFAIDLDALKASITRSTVAIFYNDLQNPLGCESTDAERVAIAELAIKHNLWVLSDEAYFEMRYSGSSTSIASLPGMAERTAILYTFSKKFAMTGWRLGAMIAPTELATVVAKLNTNDESCTNHFVQFAGVEAITGDQTEAASMIGTLRQRRDLAVSMLQSMPGVGLSKPEATFYLYPEVTELMARKGFTDVGEFATAALHDTGVSFCTRRHFGRPVGIESSQFIRFAYSGISVEDITEGLGRLHEWAVA